MQLNQKDRDQLLRLILYIDLHLDQDMSIKLLSRMIGFNESKLKEGFKLLQGTTLHRYIIDKRMARAQRLIRETDLPFKSISSQVGYRLRNFYWQFYRTTGCTPDTYRKLFRQV